MIKENTSAPAAENKMGIMPIGKLLFNMSLPMMISMLVQALYNIVDSIFVAKLSENALTAVSLAFPLQTLLIAVATGTGVGMNALLSRSLGEHKFKEANKIGVNAAFLYFLSYLVFLILGFTVVKPFYASQIKGADAEIMEMGIEYLRTVMIFSFGLLAQIYFERLLTSTGKTLFSMTSQLCGALTNIILDPIMIFGLLGCPAMGVTGAAVATVIGQCVAAVVAFTCNHNDLCDRCSFDHHAVYRLCDDVLHEPDPDCFLIHSNRCVRCIFQASEFLLHAGVRSEQWYHTDHRLQLRGTEQKTYDQNDQTQPDHCFLSDLCRILIF